MSKRWIALSIVITLLGLSYLASAEDDIVIRQDVKVPMRDGVQLSTNIFLPDAEGKFPTILVRSPYDKGDEKNGAAHRYAQAGYAYVIQDTRGRFDSEGRFDPFLTEAEDGYDTQEWVRQQPWSNGEIGTAGGSYVGFTQWSPAPLQPPALKAMCPIVTFADFHDDVVYVGGAFQLALGLGWGAMVTAQPGENIIGKDWPSILRALPLTDYATLLGREIPFYNDWLAHPNDDEYWRSATITDKYDRIQVPVYNIGGWYDIFAQATAENFRRMRESASTEEIRRAQRLLMGPWAHGGGGNKVGNREFGDVAKVDIGAIERRWFDYWLKGIDNGIMDEAPVRIFAMGINEWRNEQEWPLARTRYTKYYLHSEGNANSLHGDGLLTVVSPEEEATDHYSYDPNDPVPTTGGANLALAPIGPYDQREVEARKDVLVYTTEPLKEPVEVTGPVRMVLYASSSARDTDFTAKLVDVSPDGLAWNLTDGIVRARYRNSDIEPELIEPNRVYRYLIDLWVTSNVFLEGHRIRVEISSSNFPRFDRNPNTGKPFGQDAEVITAAQTIYHNADYPSHLLLPVIPSHP